MSDSEAGSLAPDSTADNVDSPHVSHNSRVGLVTDIHYEPDHSADIEAGVRAAVERFEREDVDRVVVLGDLIMEETPEIDRDRLDEVVGWFDGVGASVTFLAGNHDVVNLNSSGFAEAVGQDGTYGTFELAPGITGVWLDSSGERHTDARGYLTREQLDFLGDSLSAAQNAVVFVHHPVHYHDLSENGWFAEHPECGFCQNKFEFTEVVADHGNVLATFNGHTHLRHHAAYEDSHHFTVNAMHREKPGYDGATGLHAIADVSDSRIRVRHYAHDDDHPVEDWVVPFCEDATVALGGTFDPVHDGHRHLFRRAFQLGDLVVGLTGDDLAPKTRHEPRFILPFEERRASLEAVLGEMSHRHDREFDVRRLDDPGGVVTDDASITHLIVSPETVGRAVEINERRRENGLNPMTVEVVEPLLAEDSERISSTRVCRGEIDTHGNLTPNAGGRQPVDE